MDGSSERTESLVGTWALSIKPSILAEVGEWSCRRWHLKLRCLITLYSLLWVGVSGGCLV